MKKIITLIVALVSTTVAFAQFFNYTPYRGAFGEAGSADWTAGWANWDPENTNYPITNITVENDITSNTTWPAGTVVFLKNKVYVTNNAVLTIEAGTIIRGDKATEGTLIITAGAKIMAQGTASNPIVFTSNFEVTDGRGPGDWGGVIILGNAKQNQISSVVEGGLDPVKAAFGGTNDNDNSGIFSFVRIEFAGFPFQPDKEINGLTLGAVGKGTKLDHVQCSFTNDDSFEWFGGNVNATHLISYRTVDDDFDTDFGFSGNVQFGLIIRDPFLSDQSASSTSEGFESDNDGTGTTANPKTKAVFSNITLIGPYRGNLGTTLPLGADFKRAVRIRRNSSISIFNSIFTDYPTGIMLDGAATEGNAGTNSANDTLQFKNNIMAGMNTNTELSSGSTYDIGAFVSNGLNTIYPAASTVSFVNPYPADFLGADYRLQTTSPAVTGSDFTSTKFGVVLFQSVQENASNATLSLYPNPAETEVRLPINLIGNSQVLIQVLDITGKIVFITDNKEMTAGNHLIKIDVSQLSKGIYTVKMMANNNHSFGKLTVK